MRFWAKVEAGADGALHGHMHICDAIGGYDGVKPQHVVDKLEALHANGAKHLHVHIHSPGGDAFDSLAIHNSIAGWPHGEKHTHVLGLAASGASVIAMAGDKIHVAPHSMMMIHGARGLAIGDAAQMHKAADRLEGLDSVMAKLYAKRTGKSEEQIAKMMAAETWMDAKAAKKHGFADEEEEEPDREEPEGDDEECDESRFRAVASAIFGDKAPPAALELLSLNLPRAQARTLTPPAPPASKENDVPTFDEYRKQAEADAKTIAELKASNESTIKAQTDLLAATGKPTVGEALAALEGLKIQASKASEFQAEIAKRDAEAVKVAEARRAEEIKAMLCAAEKDGRLSPAKRAEWEKPEAPAFARDPVQLAACLDVLKPAVRVEGAPGPTPVPTDDNVVTLNADEERAAKAMGITPTKVAIFKAGGAPALRLVLDAENEKARAEKIAKAALQIDPSVAALAQFRK